MPEFTDETITKLFGREDAEYENKARLLEYFYRNRAYDNLTADLPIRLLVGHKGVGKSALMTVAYINDQRNGRLSLWVRPNDLHGVTATPTSDFSSLINTWKTSLGSCIWRLITEAYPSKLSARVPQQVQLGATAIISTVTAYFRELAPHAADAASAATIRNYLDKSKITIYIDDLDQGWSAAADDIRRISALFAAVRDLSGSDNRMQFRIGLRTDVSFLVRTSDESTDKDLTSPRFQSVTFDLYLPHRWISRNNLGSFSPLRQKSHDYSMSTRLYWFQSLLSLTRKRPRDLVAFPWGGEGSL